MESGHDWEIRERLKVSELGPNEQFLDRESALRWLRRFRGDHFRMVAFRRLLSPGYSSIHFYDDDEVLELLASGIARRRFHLVREAFDPWATGGGGGSAQPAAAAPQQDPPAPPPRPRPPQAEQVFEEPTFSADIDILGDRRVSEGSRQTGRAVL